MFSFLKKSKTESAWPAWPTRASRETRSLGEILHAEWQRHAFLGDESIDEGINKIIKGNDDIVFVSSLNIEVAKRKSIRNTKKSLGIDKDDWKTMIVAIHGRMHWSLLVYVKGDDYGRGFHYDSICGCNRGDCVDITWFLVTIGVIDQGFKLFEPPFFQQDRGYECGFYTILAAYLFTTRDGNERKELYASNEYYHRMDLFFELYSFLRE